MSQRTIAEFNHDYADKIRKEPERFLTLLGWALNSGDGGDWDELRRYGLSRIVQRHHSDDGEVVLTRYGTKYPLR